MPSGDSLLAVAKWLLPLPGLATYSAFLLAAQAKVTGLDPSAQSAIRTHEDWKGHRP